MRHVAQGTGHAGLALLALSMGGFAIGTTEFGTMGLVPYFSKGLHIDIESAGQVISAYALGVVVGAPVLAVAGARMRRRSLLIILMLLFALGNLLSAFAPSFGWMLLFRFIAGLPHGAYFGVAALVMAGLVPPHKRTQAIAGIMTGLTVSAIFGVPLANEIGQLLSWRWAFVLVAVMAAVTAGLVWVLVPREEEAPRRRNPLDELAALRNRQVWLTLGIGAIGFGGVFAVYTYIDSTLLQVTHAAPAAEPMVLVLFGIGMTLGNLVSARFADKALMATIAGVLLWSAASQALYPLMTGHLWSMALAAFLVGGGAGLGSPLQARLLNVAGKAQTLAAALNHSAMNTANALGPVLAGLAIGAGWGLPASGWVGCAMSLGGLSIWALAALSQRSGVLAGAE
ncbi:MFS transporter [Acidocella sp.]|uniref:MFS transporter n=1 Tax=Acidocella sp. TaxID=50710 RepID=UPI003CFD4E6E